jgi:HSP20 family protein
MAREKERQQTSQHEQKPQQQSSQQVPATGQEGRQRMSPASREPLAPWMGLESPFSFMRRFTENMERLFEDFGFERSLLGPSFGREFFPSRAQFGQAMWSPQIEVYEREGQLVIRTDLPGVNKEHVRVEVTDDEVVIQGERRQEHEETREGVYRSERSYGRFYRTIPLPEGVNTETANATFHDGVLEITMPAPERKGRARQIEIHEPPATQEQPPRARQGTPSERTAGGL